MDRCIRLEIQLNHIRSFPEPRGAINRYYFPPDSSFSFLLRSAVLAARDWIMEARREEKLLLPPSWHSSFHSYAVFGVSLLLSSLIFPPPNLLAPRDFFLLSSLPRRPIHKEPKVSQTISFPFCFFAPKSATNSQTFSFAKKMNRFCGRKFPF